MGEGGVDVLVGRDYAPLVSEESTLRATENPDDNPSVAFHTPDWSNVEPIFLTWLYMNMPTSNS